MEGTHLDGKDKEKDIQSPEKSTDNEPNLEGMML